MSLFFILLFEPMILLFFLSIKGVLIIVVKASFWYNTIDRNENGVIIYAEIKGIS